MVLRRQQQSAALRTAGDECIRRPGSTGRNRGRIIFKVQFKAERDFCAYVFANIKKFYIFNERIWAVLYLIIRMHFSIKS